MGNEGLGNGQPVLFALHRFPVHFLKVDSSFVDGLENNSSEGAAFLSAMISLAQVLGMKTVAEGVETAEQVARLREMGCEMAQGNYFSEPLPSEATSKLLATHSPI